MIFPRYRRLLAALFAVFALTAVGCSSTSTKPPPPPEFTQQEADDLAQAVGATVALDLGGWMVEIQKAQDTRRTEGDTTDIVAGAITHTLSYNFTQRMGGLHTVWDTSVVSVEVHDKGVGTFTGNGITGPHYHVSDMSIFSANEDTMFFNTLAIDTSLFTMRSFNRADTVYYHLDNFFDYSELRIHKDQPDPWPFDGTASYLIDARKLAGAGSATTTRNILVEMIITFNNTQSVPVVIFEDLGEPSTTFRYTLDLKTGVVARAP